ncbi:MAG: hypothetical protein IKS87_03470, partial [Lachnospiraceae bacterium]|nr:hypothetical protein [Lachnospiraceae bacterium]
MMMRTGKCPENIRKRSVERFLCKSTADTAVVIRQMALINDLIPALVVQDSINEAYARRINDPSVSVGLVMPSDADEADIRLIMEQISSVCK